MGRFAIGVWVLLHGSTTEEEATAIVSHHLVVSGLGMSHLLVLENSGKVSEFHFYYAMTPHAPWELLEVH